MHPTFLQARIFLLAVFLFAAFAIIPNKAEAIYPLGTEAVFYHFEDAATATSTNSGSTGSVNDGTFVGGASTSPLQARFGSRSGSFSETGDYMRTYFGSSTNPTLNSISASMWVYRKEPAVCNDADHFFGSSGQPSGSRFYMRCTTAGKWGMRFGAAAAADGTTNIVPQKWEHLAMVFDAANDAPKLYLNGTLIATSATVPSFTITNDFFVGGMNDTITTPGVLNTGENGNVYMDEVAIYNGVLSGSDITALYNAGDGVAPVISALATSSVTTTGVTVTWTTDEAASTQVEYGLTSSYTASTTLADNVTYVTSHTANITGLSPSTTYHYRVVSRDPMGTIGSSTNATFTTAGAPDTTAPVISAVGTSTASTSATITWTTDEQASSQVEYGLTSSYSATTTLADTSPRVTSHSVTITGLTPSTTYNYRILSVDGSSNLATTTNATFTTTVGNAPGQPTALAATGYDGFAYLTWTAATSTFDDYRIEYKLSSNPSWTTFVDGSSTATTTAVTGLTNDSTYNFRVTALSGSTPGLVSSTATATPFVRVAFVSPTPGPGATVNASSVSISASSSVPSNSFASSTQSLWIENIGHAIVQQVSTTTRYGDYNLTHQTSIFLNTDLSLAANSSGIAYVPTTNSLFVVHNSGVGTDSSIDEIDTSGGLIRTLVCTSCGDIEGIVLISSAASSTPGAYTHTFMISTENSETNGRIFRVSIPSTGTAAVNATDYYDMNLTHGFNLGLEGIAYNPASGVFYVAREKAPALYEVHLGTSNTATAAPVCTNLTSALNAGVTDFSDLFFMNNVLYVASEDTNPSKIIPINLANGTTTCAYYDSDGDGDVSSSDTGDWLSNMSFGGTDQIEGFTWDSTGDYLYVLAEPDYLGKYRTNTFTTRYTFSGLTDGSYYAMASAYDANGTTSRSASRSFTINTDVTAPIISAIASTTGSATATVTWTTDEASDSKVSYGTSASTYTMSTSSASSVTSHSIGLTGLSASTLYYYVVVSKDASGNIATSSERTLRTTSGADVTGPIISSVASTTAATTASVTWTTDEVSTSKVSYGLSSGTYTTSTTSPALVTSHTIGLTGLSALTQYFYVVVSADASGNYSTSTEKTLITTAVPDTTGPVISSVASSPSVTTATVTWTTDEVSDSKVSYGTSAGTYTTSTSSASSVLSHSIGLTGLSASTQYYYVVVSKDGANNYSTSSENTLTTSAAPDVTPPVISSVATSSVTDSGVTITWTTDEQASSRVAYGLSSSYTQTTSEADTSPRVTSHTLALTGLSASTLYHFAVVSRDAAGNTSTSSDLLFTTSADATAPVISAVSATTTSTTATVTWTTDELASSRLSYGPSASYNATTSEADTSPRVTSHSVTVSSLIPCSTYHFAVTSRDALANSSSGSDSTFSTIGCTGSTTVEAQTATPITTASGGSVALTDSGSGLTLDVPAAFSGSNATFQIVELNPTLFTVGAGSPTGTLNLVSDLIYHLTAFTSATTTVSSFAQPLTITITYTNSDIASFEESSLVIYRYDGSSWHALSNCVVDSGANTVTCTTSSFSDFGLFGTAKTVVEETTRRRGGGGSRIIPKANIIIAAAPTTITTATPVTTTSTTAFATSYKLPRPFVSPLYLGVVSPEVLFLQQALNSNILTRVATTGVGSAGQETTTFGRLTEAAVRAFQVRYNLAKPGDEGYGFVGPKTRALLNALYK